MANGQNQVEAGLHPEQNKRRSSVSLAVSAALFGTAFAPSLQAQQLEEIIVTATKRSESVQDVPLSITAFSGDFTRAVNLDDVKDLVSFTPGVTGNSKDSFIDVISIRGIRTNDFGNGGDPSAGFFKDNLYQGRNGAVVTSLFDMDRSEILRGPQGFLFGRNAIGGAFSTFTRKPGIDGRDGYVELDVAERGHFVVEGGMNIPVNDKFAMRVAGYHSTEDGYVNNLADPGAADLVAHDKSAFRLSGLYDSENLTVHGRIEFEQREQSGTVYRATQIGEAWENHVAVYGEGIRIGGSGRDIAAGFDALGEADDADILSIGLQIDYELPWASLSIISGYKDHDYFYAEDFDGTAVNINQYSQDQQGDYLQSEVRLASNSDSPLSWYAGASFYKEEVDTLFSQLGDEDAFCQFYSFAYYGTAYTCTDLYNNYFGYAGTPDEFVPSADGYLDERNQVNGSFQGWAAYLDLNYAFSDSLDVGVGVRYTYDEKDFALNALPGNSSLVPYWALGFTTDGFVTAKDDWDDTTPRVIVRYRPDDDHLFYGSATRGYKSGGFGSFAIAPTVPFGSAVGVTQADGFRPQVFDPETVWSYEAGYKGSLFSGGANVQISAFSYEYEDLQVVVTGNGGGILVDNVGNAKGSGLEASITATLSANVDLYLAASYLDSEVTGLQALCGLDDVEACEGSRIWWAPEFSGAAVLSTNFPLEKGAITGSLEVIWESERGGGWEGLEDSKIGAFQDWTLRVGYRSDNNWSVTAYVENLTDELTYDGSSNNGDILPAFFFGPSRPRTAGVRFGYEWE